VTDLAYLDYAATSAVRPAAVADAVASYIRDIGATPGRGGHRLAVEAGRVALRCRQRVAALLGIGGDPGRIAFTANATIALNQALWGTVRRGDRIVITAFDHNAVLRPAALLARERGAEVRLVAGHADGTIDEDAWRAAVSGARIAVVNAASNVLGTVLDVRRLCGIAREADALTLVDVAQIAGHAPFDVHDAGADLVAFSGHKGMLGPQGVGGLWVRDGIAIEPLLAGGAGGDSLDREMPAALPDRLEAGTQNGPAMAGLIAGIDAVLAEGVARIHARLSSLKGALREALSVLPDITVLSPPAPDGTPVVLIRSNRVDAATLAARLDREHGVLTRAGLHCAPEVHHIVGSASGGAVRLSLGWASTTADVERASRAVKDVVASTPSGAWHRRGVGT
jgi:cysteine desulfurase / selenocysteine lyase